MNVCMKINIRPKKSVLIDQEQTEELRLRK